MHRYIAFLDILGYRELIMNYEMKSIQSLLDNIPVYTAKPGRWENNSRVFVLNCPYFFAVIKCHIYAHIPRSH